MESRKGEPGPREIGTISNTPRRKPDLPYRNVRSAEIARDETRKKKKKLGTCDHETKKSLGAGIKDWRDETTATEMINLSVVDIARL